jgi:transposase
VKFVGWDWASTTHDITVLDQAGRIVERWACEHTEAGLAQALHRLSQHGQPGTLPVIIERTSGLVIDRLLATGHPVVPVHPSAFHAARPRWGASGAKSDPGDSFKLADYLRTDGHRLRRLEPIDAGLRQLQSLVRLRDDHIAAKTAASNQLGALLDAHWPGPKALFYRLGSPIALAFLTDYPTPESAARLGEARMAAFLRRHAYRGGKAATELLARLRSAPTPPTGLPPQVLARLLAAQIQLLRTLLDTITQLEAEIKRIITTHPQARLLQQLPGIGQLNLAQILAEIGPILDRVDNAEQAAAECGATPVTKTSGKTTGVYFRWAANTRARKAITAFAHNSRMQSRWAQGLYRDARARGKRNPHATRIVARSWIRVIWTCWHTNTPYDPLKHTAEQRAANLT